MVEIGGVITAMVTPFAADLSVDEAAEATSLGRSKLYGLIGSGELRSVKVGRRRLVPAGAVAEFIRHAADA